MRTTGSKKRNSVSFKAPAFFLAITGAVAGCMVALLLAESPQTLSIYHTLLVTSFGALMLMWLGKSVI